MYTIYSIRIGLNCHKAKAFTFKNGSSFVCLLWHVTTAHTLAHTHILPERHVLRTHAAARGFPLRSGNPALFSYALH